MLLLLFRSWYHDLKLMFYFVYREWYFNTSSTAVTCYDCACLYAWRAPTIPHYCTAWSHLYLSVTIWTRERVFIKSQFVVWRSSIFFLSFCFISLNLEDSSSSFYSEGIGHGGGWSPVFPNDTRTLSKNTYSNRSVDDRGKKEKEKTRHRLAF